jgi:adenylate cyclase
MPSPERSPEVSIAQTAKIETIPHHAWLIEKGLAGAPVPELFEAFCERLVGAGLPLARGYLSAAALHPLLWASGYRWHRGSGLEAVDIRFGFEREPAWLSSPFRHMIETRARRLRRRLAGTDARLDFPALVELRDAGLTDWLALFYSFGWPITRGLVTELGVIFSWATDHPGGWAEQESAAIEELSGTLALAARAASTHDATRTLLSTYLGRDAADRVIVGQIRRGSVERQAAVILSADLRGFTDFADAAPSEEVTRRLNDVFDCIGGPIVAAGGEILKFLGDGLLAVFLPGPGRGMATVATAALGAAQDILAATGRLNAAEEAAGRPALLLDIALHASLVTYGNVGTAERLDFTVIGPAVNEVSRLEGLCKTLGRQLLVSDAVVAAAPDLRARLRSLGHHRLRGVREAREVFTDA